jgi:hypothetical protein
VVDVMDVMMVMVVVMMVHGGSRGGRWSRLLRHGVSGEAKRENRGSGKGLDHGRTILWLGNPKWVAPDDRDLCLNSI